MKHYLLIFLQIFIIGFFANSQTTIGLIQHNEGTLDDGYVLFAPQTSSTTYLIDKCGKKVKTWESTYRPGLSCYLLEDGSLLRTGVVASPTFASGGHGGVIQKFDWDGNLTWTYFISDAINWQHHDIKALPNGNVLAIAWESKTNTQAIANGRNPQLVPSTVWSEQILEIQPTSATEGTVVWEWHLWDHLIQDFDNTKPNFGVVSNNPQLMNINFNASATNSDWIHLNSIDYNSTLDQILLSSRTLDEIWIIDHSTTSEEAASHTGGNGGKGGDLLYRWGNSLTYNIATNTQFYGQHNAQWIKEGLPYENQIMVFNNGNGRPGGNYSTIEIINPPLNGYNYNASLPYLPEAPSWIYNAGNPNNFYAALTSGCQQLSNGNVLFCQGPKGTFREITNSGTTIWVYINPVTANGILDQGAVVAGNSVFRCTFYPSNFPGFNNQILTPSTIIENVNSVSNTCILSLSNENLSMDASSLLVYPNPAKESLKIEILNQNTEKIDVKITDLLGKIVQSETLIKENGVFDLIPNKLLNGYYTLTISSNHSVYQKKILISN